MAKRKDPPPASPGGLKESLGRALEHHHRRRRQIIQPSKAEKAQRARDKRDQKSAISEAIRYADPRAVGMLIPPEAQRHGDYQLVDFKLQEVTEGGKRVEKTIRVVRNLGGTPCERWYARGSLDERQMAAILFYQSAWRLWIGEPRVVANWDAVICRQAMGAVEIYAGTRLAAKESLRLLDQEVFFRLGVEHFECWQNVVIWDEPAGVAGSRAGFLHKQAEGAARAIVVMIASMIADLIIDNSRRDFGDLLLDLDAPRRPGRRRA